MMNQQNTATATNGNASSSSSASASSSFLSTDRAVLTLIGSTLFVALSGVSGLSALSAIIDANSELLSRYPEVHLLDLLINAKKKLAKPGEMSWKPVIDVLNTIHEEVLADPVFTNLIDAMRNNPKRYDSTTGLKLEVAAGKVVDYLLKNLLEATNYFSHPAKDFKTAFVSDVPFSPVDVMLDEDAAAPALNQQRK